MTACLNPVATCAIHLKNSLPLRRVPVKRQHVLHVGISGAKLINSDRDPNQHNRDRQAGQDNLLNRTFFSDKLIIQTI